MGGQMKALAPLGGKPLLRHVIDRMAPQVSTLMLSVEQPCEELDVYQLQQVPDHVPDGGPLGGLLAGLQALGEGSDWLVLVPCDAPFIPRDLAAGLLNCAVASERPGAVIRYQAEVQPTFSIWHRSIKAKLEQAVQEQGMGGFKQFLRVCDAAGLDWPPSEPSPFFNINDRDALREAGRLLGASPG